MASQEESQETVRQDDDDALASPANETSDSPAEEGVTRQQLSAKPMEEPMETKDLTTSRPSKPAEAPSTNGSGYIAGTSEPWGGMPLSKEKMLLKLKRIYRLTEKPPNPGFAYRHLEYIRILTSSMLEELGAADIIEEPTTLDTDRESLLKVWNPGK